MGAAAGLAVAFALLVVCYLLIYRLILAVRECERRLDELEDDDGRPGGP